MTISMSLRPIRGVVLGALALLGACASSSTSYIADQTGYAVTRGRIVAVENLYTDNIEPLADGLAVTVSQPGCRVTMQFEDERTMEFDVDPGVVLVYGYGDDYIMRSERATPAR